MLYYLRVWVAHASYHGTEALTYSHTEPLAPGIVVLVPLRKILVKAIVYEETVKPSFTARAIAEIKTVQPLPKYNLELLSWLMSYYPAPGGVIASLFLPSDLLKGTNSFQAIETADTDNNISRQPLTKDQQRALVQIKNTNQPVLIHGETGTGKTRVYLERALEVLAHGKSVLLLTPEIGLTPQLQASFQEYLPHQVLTFHSTLTSKERRERWLKLLHTTKPMVVIGPRSALFTPVANLGLIIVDEAHDNSYKQDQAPRYNALRVAGKLASISKAQLIYGTATPLIQEYFIFKAKKLPIIRMEQLAAQQTSHPLTVDVVDSRERQHYSKHPVLSDALLHGISNSINNGEQALVFLNRRGTARSVLCQRCGWQALCPHCHIALTYHGDVHLLRCHTCGFKDTPVSVCPDCGGLDIVYSSIGTKALMSALQNLYPSARIARFDTDNTKDQALAEHYETIRRGEIDILVGTQMLVKGLDLPLLSFVGVVSADSSLQFPDYTAEELTYQLLTQVVGRVGRGHRQSSVVIQTYNPLSSPLQAVLHKNWDEFYQQQIAERKQFMFPPFCYLLKLSCSRKSQVAAIAAATKLRKTLNSSALAIEIVGPSPCFKEQSHGNFNWQLVIKSKSRDQLIAVIHQLPANWTYDLDPVNLL